MRALENRIPAPVVALLLGGLMKAYALAAALPAEPSPTRVTVAVALAQLSAVIVLAAFASFWRARTTINPLHPSRASRLVTHGIFRLSRNPMYLSLLLLLVAYAIRLDALAAWLAPALFAVYVTRFQIVPEERALAAKFGPEYQAYRQRTRRWI